MQVIKQALQADWSRPLIGVSLFLVGAFVFIQLCGWLLNKLPVPPGRRENERNREG